MIDRWLGEDGDIGHLLTSWLGDQSTVKAGDAQREIADDPVSIVLLRAGTPLASQTVRIVASLPGGSTSYSEGAEAGMDTVTILGDEDFDVQYGDRFMADSQLYEVTYVSPGQNNRIEARARTVQ